MRDHRRGAARGGDDPDVAAARVPRQRGDGLGAAPGVVGAGGVGPDARDADEAFEVGPRPRQDVGHRGGELDGAVISLVRHGADATRDDAAPFPDVGRSTAGFRRRTLAGMSRFLTMLLDTAAGSALGMTTGEPRTPVRRSWPEIHESARRAAGALTAAGIGRDSAVGVLAGEPAAIAPAAQAVWLVGGSVTMLHQPTPRTDLAVWAKETVGVLTMIGAKIVLLGAPFEALGGVLAQHGIPCRLLADLDGEPVTPDADVAGEDDTALLQLTSGSTAEPKAVRITHRNLHANIGAMVQAARLDTGRDVMVSWLPLFHDMGMVGFLTVPMTVGIELVSATPTDFLGRPLLWAELISRYAGTVTAAPNFAYAVLARQLARADEGSMDLSTLRFALNGAEPIDPAAVTAFTTAGARFGLRAGVCRLCLRDGRDGAGRVVRADRHGAAGRRDRRRRAGGAPPRRPGRRRPGAAVPAARATAAGDRDPGRRRRGCRARRAGGRGAAAARRVGDAGLPDRRRSGRDAGRRRLARHRRRGLPDRRRVVVCGRRKDVIIMGGRNIYPTDIERAASGADGVRAGNAVAVRLEADGARHRESFLVAVESRRATEPEAAQGIAKDVTSRVVSAVGVRPAEVVVLRPGSLPKTPSGKLRRAATRALLAARG